MASIIVYKIFDVNTDEVIEDGVTGNTDLLKVGEPLEVHDKRDGSSTQAQ